MKVFPTTSAVSFGLSYGLVWYAQFKGFDLSAFYSKLQPSLFTGFLTLGGFLLSLMVFIVVQLKKELFDDKNYQQHHEAVSKIQQTSSLYEPLKNLGSYLLYSVLFSLVTSLSQITIGLLPYTHAKIFCVAIALTTFCVVIRAWMAIRLTLKNWFDHLK